MTARRKHGLHGHHTPQFSSCIRKRRIASTQRHLSTLFARSLRPTSCSYGRGHPTAQAQVWRAPKPIPKGVCVWWGIPSNSILPFIWAHWPIFVVVWILHPAPILHIQTCSICLPLREGHLYLVWSRLRATGEFFRIHYFKILNPYCSAPPLVVFLTHYLCRLPSTPVLLMSGVFWPDSPSFLGFDNRPARRWIHLVVRS